MTTTCHDHMKLSDHDHHQFQLLNEKNQKKSPIVSGHFLSYSNVQDQGSHHPRKAHQVKHQQEVYTLANNFATEGGSSSDHSSKKSTLWNNNNEQGNQMSGTRYQNIPTKWLPSKLRLVHRMMGSATDAQVNPHTKFKESPRKSSSSPEETTESCNNGSFSTPVTRVCSDCNTTKTPLWRSGPRGPKSLCNACGIRQRKARQALAAAASAASGTCLEVEGPRPSKPKVQEKDKRLKINIHITPYKKRSKIANNIGKKNKLCFEDLLISLSKNLAFHQIFPQDEKEAAILLMALSCGLVHG